MTIDHAIYKLLSDELSFTDSPNQIGARDDLPKIPQVAYKNISSPAIDDRPNRWERWRFFIRAESFTDCQDIADTVLTTLENGSGTVTDGAESMYIDQTDFIDYASSPTKTEAGIYETITDIRIIWRKN